MHGFRRRWRLRPPASETPSPASSPPSSPPSAPMIPIPSSPLSNSSPSSTCQFPLLNFSIAAVSFFLIHPSIFFVFAFAVFLPAHSIRRILEYRFSWFSVFFFWFWLLGAVVRGFGKRCWICDRRLWSVVRSYWKS